MDLSTDGFFSNAFFFADDSNVPMTNPGQNLGLKFEGNTRRAVTAGSQSLSDSPADDRQWNNPVQTQSQCRKR